MHRAWYQTTYSRTTIVQFTVWRHRRCMSVMIVNISIDKRRWGCRWHNCRWWSALQTCWKNKTRTFRHRFRCKLKKLCRSTTWCISNRDSYSWTICLMWCDWSIVVILIFELWNRCIFVNWRCKTVFCRSQSRQESISCFPQFNNFLFFFL